MQVTSLSLRRWISGFMAVALVISLVVWYFTHREPSRIRLATGDKGGQYHKFGQLLQDVFEKNNSSTKVVLIDSEGSVHNYDLLKKGDVDLIMVQGGTINLAGYAVVAPLYPDIMHIVVRRDRDIHELTDLAGHRVILGKEGSGMRESARKLLKHYGLLENIEEVEGVDFTSIESDEKADAAIVTTGILNPDLLRIMSTGKYSLLEVRDAKAIEMNNPYLSTFVIPRGLYREQPPVPEADVPTLATTAFLIGKRGASDVLTNLVLKAVYQEGMRLRMPTLYTREKAENWLDLPLHPAARRFFDPQDDIGHLASVMESLAATKELLFALIAGVYLVWERWRRLKEKEIQAELRQQKSHLDELLTSTLQIEAKQIGMTDEKLLRQMLDDVTHIKLQALEELTHEELRGDRSFLIFLTQSSSLSNKIQAKISDSRRDS